LSYHKKITRLNWIPKLIRFPIVNRKSKLH